ncbi:hypothetical protein [Methylocystis echinoides]|uniref:hypothetical protein n=1 Tax=Methylocystis echinoides TaxID=29468 RepID=UPI00341E22C8
MTEQPQGRYRTPGEAGKPNMAFVEVGRIGLEISEQDYRDRGYEPAFEALPWKKDYCPVDEKGDEG